MNVQSFFAHHGIAENPFRAEEAWQDAVFGRLERACRHPDFEKVCGDFTRPSSAIVFGERGSGKTAIRMQIEHAVADWNATHEDDRCLAVAYDDLNPVLDRLRRHLGRQDVKETIESIRLTDHMDGILAAAVPGIVDQLLGTLRGRPAPLQPADDVAKRLRHLDRLTKRDLLMLQICYDRPDAAAQRTGPLKRALRYRSANASSGWKWGALTLGVLALAGIIVFLLVDPPQYAWLWQVAIGALALGALAMGVRWGLLWSRTQRLAHGLSRHLRVLNRPTTSFRTSLGHLRIEEALAADLPASRADDPRYAMFARLLGALRGFGYRSMIVLVDRVDEPTLVNGEPQRMRALVWPLLHSKFLQMDQVGVKLLLPLELRWLLEREGTELFREARLDKQNYIERLSWSGAMLYDLCTARVNACRDTSPAPGPDASPDTDADTSAVPSAVEGPVPSAVEGPLSLMEFFEPTITHQDIVDALDQMQQPRDAFKFLYQLVQEHCSNVPEEKPAWKIARQTLDSVRKQQTERLAAMLRGVRPA